ncbi:MAG: twin-arginine translocase subunit TatC [Gemmatimonadales bacterium]|nr:twin-arginine translocase subunit TatC [Gemmatimonadales bacterium]
MAPAAGEMPFLDHLEELRSRLFRIIAALVVGVGIGLWAVFQFDVIIHFKAPIAPYLPEGKLAVMQVTEQFFITLKLGALIGAVLASPVIIYQIWAFLSPALYDRERKAIVPALAVGLVLFLIGGAAGWIFVVPRGLVVLLGYFPDAFNLLITYDAYFSFVAAVVLGLGISFELPLVMVMLGVVGVMDARRYGAFRRYAIFFSAVAAALLSPGGDVFLMLVFMGPLVLLYEIGVLGTRLLDRRRRRDAAIGALVLLGLAGMPARAEAQVQVPRPTKTTEGRVTPDTGRGRPGARQQARELDSTTAKRLGLPTAPVREFPSPDSIMQALLARPGFAVTRYLGDSARLVADSETVILGGRAATSRDGTVMEAERIVYDNPGCLLLATGEPRLFEDAKIAVGRTLRFDTCVNRGVFDEAFTTFDELGSNWFVRGNLAVDSSASRLYAAGGEFTSCDLPEAHYHFQAGEVKWVSNSYLVARPAVLYVRDVPIAWLPFLFQDTKPGRRSGILIPQFGFNDIVRPTRGYNRQVTNVGYYWAPNDYIDATVRFDWFASRFIQYGAALNYNWLDRFVDGGLAVNRQVESGGTASTQLQWNHRQAFSASTRLNFQVDYITDSRVQAGNAVDPLLSTRQITSSATLNKKFAWGDVTLGGTRRQNVSDGSGQMTLPSLTITPAAFAFGNSITWSPTFSATNDLTFKTPQAPLLVTNGTALDTLLDTGSSRVSTVRLNTPFQFGQFTWNNNLSYTDRIETARRVVTEKIPNLATPEPDDSISVSRIRGGDFQTALNWETGINLPGLLKNSWNIIPSVAVRNVLPGQPFLLRNAATNGEWVQQGKRLQLGLQSTPNFYAFLNRGVGPYDRFRHKISPRFTLDYSPEASVPEAFANAIPGQTTVAPPRLLATVQLTNTFEAKPNPAPGDTTTDPRTVRPVTLLAVTTSAVGFDFEQAKLDGRRGWTTQTLTNQVSSDLISGLTLSLTHDLWRGVVGTDTATFEPFLSSVQANFTLTGKTFRSIAGILGLGGGRVEREEPDTMPPSYTQPSAQRLRPGAFSMGNPQLAGMTRGGFQASVSYSLTRQRPGGGTVTTPGQVIPGGIPGDDFTPIGLPFTQPDARSSVNLNLSFSPTTFWNVRWSTQYNVTDGRFESHQIQLQRDLHDWRAEFNFARSANGNFALFFNIYLLSLPDIKFDYNQTTLSP